MLHVLSSIASRPLLLYLLPAFLFQFHGYYSTVLYNEWSCYNNSNSELLCRCRPPMHIQYMLMLHVLSSIASRSLYLLFWKLFCLIWSPNTLLPTYIISLYILYCTVLYSWLFSQDNIGRAIVVLAWYVLIYLCSFTIISTWHSGTQQIVYFTTAFILL